MSKIYTSKTTISAAHAEINRRRGIGHVPQNGDCAPNGGMHKQKGHSPVSMSNSKQASGAK